MMGVLVFCPLHRVVAVEDHKALHPVASLRVSAALRDDGSDKGRWADVNL